VSKWGGKKTWKGKRGAEGLRVCQEEPTITKVLEKMRFNIEGFQARFGETNVRFKGPPAPGKLTREGEWGMGEKTNNRPQKKGEYNATTKGKSVNKKYLAKGTGVIHHKAQDAKITVCERLLTEESKIWENPLPAKVLIKREVKNT